MPKDQLRIPALDGYPLAATFFPAAAAAAPLVIIASATAVRRGYYARFTQFLARHGLQAVTFDYRGIGASRPPRLAGFRASLHEWGELDLAGVIQWAAQEIRPPKLLLVGHSVAGQIFPLAENHDLVQAACFVASQFGYWKLWHGKERPLIWALWHVVIPGATAVFDYFPGWLMGAGADLPGGVAAEWARWGRHPDYVLSHRADVRERFAAVRLPLQFLSFSDDALYAPQPAVVALMQAYGSTEKKHRHLEPHEVGRRQIGHFGFFREAASAALWQETLAWLQTHAAGEPQ